MFARPLLAAAFALALSACAATPATPPAARPIAPAAPVETTATFPRGGMASAADPRAVDAANEMLAQGGSATDAAIAAMMVLGLVEPHSAGIGGGGFLLHYEAARSQVRAYDGRETAPMGAKPDMFLENGKPLNFRDAVVSGHSVGAPSLVAMLKMAHDRHGRLAWARLFDPAIRLAEGGFQVSPRLHLLMGFVASRGGPAHPEAKAYLLTEDGKPRPVGSVMTNPDYASALRAIARQGPRALTHGPIAAAIVEAAQRGPRGGTLTLADLQAYKPRELTPLCGAYRAYRVCGMPPPSSGGIAVLEILGLFEQTRPTPEGPASVDDWAAFLWASRLAYADRDHYVGDDQFVPVPTYGLIAPAYVAHRAKDIDLAKAPQAFVAPGDPSVVLGGESLLDRWGMETPSQSTGTTHLSVVDAAGNAVALTATVESVFGSQRMASGFFLNNQLTDFSLIPERNGKPVANAVAPGKRPRSSMAPTIILTPDNQLSAVTGSPGGSAIIAYVAKSVIGIVDWRLSAQAAIDLPNLTTRGAIVRTEMDRAGPALTGALAQRGWTLEPTTLEASGLHAIVVRPEGLEGGADPRREGKAEGPLEAPARRR